MKALFFVLFLLISYNLFSSRWDVQMDGFAAFAQTKYPVPTESGCIRKINLEIGKGNFSKATELIDQIIRTKSLMEVEIYNLDFQKERMGRIRKDFQKTANDILAYVKKYYPDADENMLRDWEKDGSLEYLIIDGQKFYFNSAAPNLFRINREAKKRKVEVDGIKIDGLDKFLQGYIPEVVKESKKSSSSSIKPIQLKLNYTLTVDANVVPDGELIRCWLPYPREISGRQTNIKLISVNSDEYVIANNDHQQRTIYIEKKSEKDKSTIFNYELIYTSYGKCFNLDPASIVPYNKEIELYKNFTTEREPHIVFTDRIRRLSTEIVGSETNSFITAKKIFTWINANIPWASAREYSTIENISDYCLKNMHGDCGIKTLLFMTLCRYNGIPTKWQSGWMLHPGEVNLHDWCEIYFENIGWVPVDQSFGLKDFQPARRTQADEAGGSEELKYFYLGSMDAYRLIVNNDYSTPLYPTKIFPRSETVDFQRGEVEWRGGNLYFDKWDYKMKVEYSN